jgi:hypothetical protein
MTEVRPWRAGRRSTCEPWPIGVVAQGTASKKGEGMAPALALPIGATLVIPGIVLVVIVVLVILWIL